MSESDAVRQLALRFTDPVQHDDEVIRGIMRADETIVECSRATGIDWDPTLDGAPLRPPVR